MHWSWWPSADGSTWEWAWTPYPGVWLVVGVALLLMGITLLWLRGRPGAVLERHGHRRRAVWFTLGLLTTWIALDWPLGALATNLLSARIVQYLLLALVAAPLLLLGLPPIPTPRPRWPRPVARVGRFLVHPLPAAVLFAIVLLASHLPAGVNAVDPNPVSAAALRLGWLAVGLIYWWPLVGPGPDRIRLPYLGAAGYLVLPFVLPKAPGVLYLFIDEPIYTPFAHGSHTWGLSPTIDQGIAGAIIWIVGSVMVLAAVYAVFRRWAQEDRALVEEGSLALPADPEALELLLSEPGAWDVLEMLVQIIEDALPERPTGASLAFRIRRRRFEGGWRDEVVLEVQLAATEAERMRLESRITAHYAAKMVELDAERREAIGDLLSVEVERIGARVQ